VSAHRTPKASDAPLTDALREAIARTTGEDHDRGLIVERLAWTPEQRLDAHTAFLRFYASVRPDGPVIRDE
jgi:hypothetical protein